MAVAEEQLRSLFKTNNAEGVSSLQQGFVLPFYVRNITNVHCMESVVKKRMATWTRLETINWKSQVQTIKKKHSKRVIRCENSVINTSRRELLNISFGSAASLLFFRIENAKGVALKDDYNGVLPDEEYTVAVFENSTKSVVSIQNFEVPAGVPLNVAESKAELQGNGSGFIWDEYGHIVTNYHVIAKLATDNTGRQRTKVSVTGPDGKVTVHLASVVGVEPSRDLAVLKIEVDPTRLVPASIGTSRDLKVGQSCYAIGNPRGLDHTLTVGVVSGLGREIPSPAGTSIPGAIQTDAAINAGNSGGPLLDSFGRVIGVNTASFTRRGTGISSGVNFAVPIDTVRRILPSLIVYGKYEKNSISVEI